MEFQNSLGRTLFASKVATFHIYLYIVVKYTILQVSTESQTDLPFVESIAIKLFNRIYKSDISECVSFILENTLADDNTSIYVDTISQTGDVLLDKQIQTLKTDLKFNYIFHCMVTEPVAGSLD